MPTADPVQLEVPTGHFIAGSLLRTGAPGIEVRRPSDGKPYAMLEVAGAQLVDEAVRDANRAWEHSDWASRPPRERARVLKRWADLIEDGARRQAVEANLRFKSVVMDFSAA